MTDALSQPAVVRTQAKIRTAGRAIAVQLLYAYEQNKYVDDGQLLTDDVPTDDGVDPLALAYAKELFTCFIANRVPVDAAIDKRLENWTIHRLAVADRSVLRLGAVEILYRTDTPPKVAINEAIELAKSFGSEDKTAKLVNGVLDRLARDHRADDLSKKG